MTCRGVALAGWSVAGALAAPQAFAQAWVPAAGHGSLTFAVQGIDNTGHVVTNGSTQPAGRSRTVSLYMEAYYAITDRLSVSAGIPYVFAKYLGPPMGNPEPAFVRPVDRCYCWQQDLQDFGFAARFNVLNGATALTPSVSYGLPSHDYAYEGEAVAGRRLRELRLAVDVGRRLDFLTPRLAVSARYSYAVVESVLDVPNDRSNVSAEVSFDVADALALEVAVYRQVTHGGLRAGSERPPEKGYPWGEIVTAELFREHDRLMRDSYWRVGAGVAYAFRRAEVFASYVEFVAGSDTHAGRSLTLGLSLHFGR